MKKEEVLSTILDKQIIAIVRLKDGARVSEVIDHLVIGGIEVMEITSNTPNFTFEIAEARKKYPQILIGAGTITNDELAKMAIEAGAQFLVTPNTNKSVSEIAIESGKPIIMGAFTPTEIANAIYYGADIVKLFPGNHLGVNYFKSIKGPFSDRKFFAVGGIGLDNMMDWLEAGIDGLGIGSTLVGSDIDTKEGLDSIILKAGQFKKALLNYESLTDSKH